MDLSFPPTITSFVIRFVLTSEGELLEGSPLPAYRGTIRHIQTEQELNFSSWQEAVAFIQRFVPLDQKIE